MAIVIVAVVLFASCAGENAIKPEPEEVIKTNTVEVPVLIEKDKLVNILSTLFCDGKNFILGKKIIGTFDVAHQYQVIEKPADEHAAATIVSRNGMEWKDSNGQLTNGTFNITEGENYSLAGTIYPAENYSSITKVHPKVSLVVTHHVLDGTASVTVDEDTQSTHFEFDIPRPYLLVDPTVDVQTVIHTDSVDRIIIKHDTIDHDVLVEVHDTIKIEVERFVKGADLLKSVVNDFGFANGTLQLGDNQLLAVEIKHQYPLLSVEKNILGSANFSKVALHWEGTDGQKTTATVSAAEGCTVENVSYLRSEFKTLFENSLVQVRTIYQVTGTYKNENGDVCEFAMELAPSYLQSYEEVVPVNNDPVYHYEVDEKYTDKEANNVKTRKLTVKITKYDQDNNVVATWKLLRGVVISGHISGYDLNVMGTTITEKVYTDEDDSRPQYNYENVAIEGNTQFTETMKTHLWRYQNHWVSDAGGDVYTDSHLLFQSCVITFTDGDFEWHSKSFTKSAEVVYDNIDNDADMVGKTKSESGNSYTYGGTHRLSVKNLVDGEEFFTSTAVSPLWVLQK